MGNINIETDLKDNLRSLNIKYQWVDIDPCFADTADFCREYGYKIQDSWEDMRKVWIALLRSVIATKQQLPLPQNKNAQKHSS